MLCLRRSTPVPEPSPAVYGSLWDEVHQNLEHCYLVFISKSVVLFPCAIQGKF